MRWLTSPTLLASSAGISRTVMAFILRVISPHTRRPLLMRANPSRIPTVPLCHHQITFVHLREIVDVVGSITTFVPVVCEGCAVSASIVDHVVDVTSPVHCCSDSNCHALGIHALTMTTVKKRSVPRKRRENVFMGKKKTKKYCVYRIPYNALLYSRLWQKMQVNLHHFLMGNSWIEFKLNISDAIVIAEFSCDIP